MKYFVASENDFFDTDSFNPTAAAKDVFVHISAVEKAELSSLNDARGSYEEMNRGKLPKI